MRILTSRTLTCLLGISCVAISPAQPEIMIGPEIIHPTGFPAPEKTLGMDADGIYVQREGEGREIALERYGHDLTLRHSSTFTPTYRGQTVEPWYLVRHTEHIYLIAKALQDGSDTAVFLTTRIDHTTLLPTDEWKLLGKVDTKGRKPTVSLYNGLRGTTLEFGTKERGTEKQFASHGQEHGRVFYTDYAMHKEERDVHDLVLVDDAMNLKWSHRVALDETEGEFDLWQTRLAPNDVVYMLGQKTNGGGKEVVGGKPNYVFRVYGIDGDGLTMSATIDLGSKFLMSAHMEFKGDILKVTGTFAEDADMNIRGLYHQEIDAKTGTIISQGEVPFSRELFVQLYGAEKGGKQYDKFLDSKKFGLGYFKVNDVYPRADGGYRIIGEIRLKTEIARNSTRPGAIPSIKYQKTAYIPIYHTEQVFILDVDRAWNAMSTAVIQKEQDVAYDQGFSSVADIAVSDAGHHFFLFNDHVDNLTNEDLANGKPVKWVGRKGCVVLVELDENGAQTRRSLIDIKEEETAIYTSAVIETGEREKVVLCRFKGNEHWMRVRW